MPQIILLFSGKRKCGKDFLTDHLKSKLDDQFEIVKISLPIKSYWAKEMNLNLNELLGDSQYKENYRLQMIEWSDKMRKQDYGCFCRIACENAKDKPIWIVSDIRRKTDVRWFKETYGNHIRTIRLIADEETRIERGYQFKPGVDDVASECDLDDYEEWDLIINNGKDGEPLEKQIEQVLKSAQREVAFVGLRAEGIDAAARARACAPRLRFSSPSDGGGALHNFVAALRARPYPERQPRARPTRRHAQRALSRPLRNARSLKRRRKRERIRFGVIISVLRFGFRRFWLYFCKELECGGPAVGRRGGKIADVARAPTQQSDMKNLAPLLAVPISEYVVTFISLVAAATLFSWTTEGRSARRWLAEDRGRRECSRARFPYHTHPPIHC
ncbi:unnamed protein product [Leptosia nina]|uniref:Phosphomevalonate kinase n=1 Tax=Leptosia nina TaxID=320188 RepID=A0AAV1IY90_9NEOP